MRSIRLTALAFLLAIAAPHSARADYFVWNDPGTGLHVSFPDTWKTVHSQDPNDLLTVMAPSGRAHAACRVRVNEDRRFMVYPPRYNWAIQKINFSYDYWDTYLQEYTNHKIEAVYDGAGSGRGFASYALTSYDSAIPGPDMHRRALMFVSHYNDKDYVTECSSHADAFDSYKRIFLSVAGSVEFRKIHHEATTGHYRNFLADPNMVFIDMDGNKREHY
jgi:hypothetical protein